MKHLSVVLLFMVIVFPLIIANDTKQDIEKRNVELQRSYSEDFQAAVDDAGAYLARFESQQSTTAIRYQREKQINTDMDMLNVFFDNLSLKYGIEGNVTALENLKMHMPGMVIFRYDGYVLITLEDKLNAEQKSTLEPVFWPIRPYTYTLKNGNILTFTLDDEASVYNVNTNQYLQGSFDELRTVTNLEPLENINVFRQVRQLTITKLVEKDLSGVINRHLELVKRMDLNIQFTLPRGLDEQSIQDIGFMAFVQGYPMSNGQLFDGFAFGGSSVMQRKAYVGTITPSGRHVAYQEGCVPNDTTPIETIYDPIEAVQKGYFIEGCFKP